MTLSIARKFALQNLKANRLFEIPCVLSSGIMFAIFNIMASLITNNYVQTRHSYLPTIIIFGIVIVAILSIVFVLYSTNFLLKRRNKEFALYSILGLEKKHIRKIIIIEFFVLFLYIFALAEIAGYVFGKLSFLILTRLMKDINGTIMYYPFSKIACLCTLILSFVMYIFTVLRIGFRVHLSTPMQLLQKQHNGEGEPKSRWIIMILGFLVLFVGYYIALTIKGVISSLVSFFIASLLVMLATYLLYISFSVIVLKAQKKKKSYFKTTNFLKISGLMYRMKSNAVSLASISILSVGIIITLSATVCIYANIDTVAKNTLPRQYHMETRVKANLDNYLELPKSLNQIVKSTTDDKSDISDMYTTYFMMSTALRNGDMFEDYRQGKSGIPNFIMVYDLASYNARTNKNIFLNSDEALLCANSHDMSKMDNLIIGDRQFKITNIENIIPPNYAVDVYGLVVKDFETMNYIANELKSLDFKTKEYTPADIECYIDWNMNNISEENYIPKLKKIAKDNSYKVEFLSEYKESIYEINGGFLFLGLIITIVFLTGNILISYYKQISEAYEDREKYEIMKKVGLDDKTIKKTTSSQVIALFFLPLALAVLHSLVASKITYGLLGMFGIRNFMDFAKYYTAIIAIFFALYFIIFKLTSRAYYKIVK